jgi:hypothetical protein
LAIYTGNLEPVKTYTEECFGTSLNFKFGAFSIANSNIDLLKADGHTFAVAILTAKLMLEADGQASSREKYYLEICAHIKQKNFDPRQAYSFH